MEVDSEDWQLIKKSYKGTSRTGHCLNIMQGVVRIGHCLKNMQGSEDWPLLNITQWNKQSEKEAIPPTKMPYGKNRD